MAWKARCRDDSSECDYFVIWHDEKGGFFIFRFDAQDEMLFGDDFCLTLKEAKEFVEWAYGVPLDAWMEFSFPKEKWFSPDPPEAEAAG